MEPDQLFTFNADPDPDPVPHQSDANLQPIVHRTSKAPFEPARLHFENSRNSPARF
jgi:hypothetical protein